MAHLWLQNKTFSLKMKKVLKKIKLPQHPVTAHTTVNHMNHS